MLRWSVEWNPPLRTEVKRFRISLRIPAHVVWDEGNAGKLGHLPTTWKHIIFEGHLQVKGHRGPYAQGFVDHPVQIGHLIWGQTLPVHGFPRRQFLHDLIMKSLLDILVLGEFIDHPRQQASSGVPSCNDQVKHHLLHKVTAELCLQKQSLPVPGMKQEQMEQENPWKKHEIHRKTSRYRWHNSKYMVRLLTSNLIIFKLSRGTNRSFLSENFGSSRQFFTKRLASRSRILVHLLSCRCWGDRKS